MRYQVLVAAFAINVNPEEVELVPFGIGFKSGGFTVSPGYPGTAGDAWNVTVPAPEV